MVCGVLGNVGLPESRKIGTRDAKFRREAFRDMTPRRMRSRMAVKEQDRRAVSYVADTEMACG